MRADGGFTLIEVLVALSIFSIAVLAVLKAQGESVIASAAVEERAMAEIVAENRLIETVLSVELPQPGEQAGTAELAGREWIWTQVVSATADADLSRIDVSVKAVETGSVLASLSGFRGSR